MKRYMVLLLIIGINSTALVAPQTASASGSKFYENVDELYDRPYAVGALSSAYACIKVPNVKATTTTSTNTAGDNVTTSITYQTNMPVLYEYDSTTWYWVSKDGTYNQYGNPCSNGFTSIWFSDINLSMPNNISATKLAVTLQIDTPVPVITTIVKHHKFLGFYKTTSSTKDGQVSTLANGTVTLYRSMSDGFSDYVGSDQSFINAPTAYQARQETFTKWFPNY